MYSVLDIDFQSSDHNDYIEISISRSVQQWQLLYFVLVPIRSNYKMYS